MSRTYAETCWCLNEVIERVINGMNDHQRLKSRLRRFDRSTTPINELWLKNYKNPEIEILTVTLRDDYTPHDTRWQCTAKTFIMACLNAYLGIWHKLCISSAQKFEKCHFRSIFGSFPVKFPPKNFLFGKILLLQKIRLWISERGLLRYLWAIVFISAVISRRFWQSTASSYRDC